MSIRHACVFLVACSNAPFRVEQRAPGSVTLAADDESALLIAEHPDPCTQPLVQIDGEPRAANVLTAQRTFSVTVTPEDATLTVLHKKRGGSGVRHIDLNLFVTASTGFDQDAAPRNAALRAILDHANQTLAQADIQLGAVRYFYLRAVGDAIAYFDCAADGSFTLGSAHPIWAGLDAPFGINVLLVNAIDVTTNAPFEQYQVAGFSPVPGAGIHTAQIRDGLVLTLADFDLDATWGLQLAHEIGHYLGLFHIIEKDGTSIDPIGDATDLVNNLMHWSGRGFALSPGQIAHMRLHPLVY